MFIYKAPSIHLLLPLIAGMLLAMWSGVGIVMNVSTMFIAIGAGILSAKSIGLKAIFLTVTMIATGWWLMSKENAEVAWPTAETAQTEAETTTKTAKITAKPKAITATLLIISTPSDKGKSVRCDAAIIEVSDKECNAWKGRKIRLYMAKNSFPKAIKGHSSGSDSTDVEMGSCILARFTPKPPENFSQQFDYVSYLHHQGITATAFLKFNSWQHANNARLPFHWQLRIMADQCRDHLIQVYSKYGIEGDGLALVSALSLGRKDLMDSESRNKYSAAGVSHVLAVSGMHVGIVRAFTDAVVGFLMILISWPVKFARQRKTPKSNPLSTESTTIITHRTSLIIRQVSVVAVLWAYAFLTGLSASVIRAVTMFTISAGAVCLNRRAETWNTLFLTAFLMLCANPVYLLDVGFQMSFMAVASILLFQPGFNRLLGWEDSASTLEWFVGGITQSPDNLSQNPRDISTRLSPFSILPIYILKKTLHYMFSSMILSVAAQIGTTPLSVYYFHRFPQWFLLANLILVPAAVAITYMALAFQCLAAIPVIPDTGLSSMAIILNLSLSLFTRFAFFVNDLPGAVTDGLVPRIGELIMAYLIIYATFSFSQKNTYLYRLENLLRRIRCAKYHKYQSHN